MKKRKRGPDLLRILALLTYFLLIAYAWVYIFMPRSIPAYLRVLIPGNRKNILVMGIDQTYDENHRPVKRRRTDTMIFVQLDPFAGKMNLISIPRDSYVNIPGHGKDKINVAYALGFKDLALDTVSRFLGVHIDKYVVINPESFAALIDSLGGIKVFVDKDMYYKDNWGGLYINLKKGSRKLNGKQAEGFIRYRHDSLGDISRVQRQQVFLKALMKKVSSPSGMVRLPWVVPLVKKTVNTDFSLFDILESGNFVRMLRPEDIKAYYIPGEFSSAESPVSYWYPDRKEKEALVQKLKMW